mmetsp:Transcript_127720/g.180210  ORF Transcript_127720/g.180210 Transcript_127720/m.180210 type:complete len:92 (-) Transcript_127720:89-364(-)
MKDYLYGFEVDEAAAGKMDQGSAPGVLHRVTIPLDGGKVLWGHGMIDSGKDEAEGEWKPCEVSSAPHVHSSVTEYFGEMGAAHAGGAAPKM